MVVLDVEVVAVCCGQSLHDGANGFGLNTFSDQEMNMGGEERIGIDFAITSLLEVVENAGVELRVFVIVEKG